MAIAGALYSLERRHAQRLYCVVFVFEMIVRMSQWTTPEIVAFVDKMMSMSVSFNLYMFAGGSNGADFNGFTFSFFIITRSSLHNAITEQCFFCQSVDRRRHEAVRSTNVIVRLRRSNIGCVCDDADFERRLALLIAIRMFVLVFDRSTQSRAS